jgi:hypothetical protein
MNAAIFYQPFKFLTDSPMKIKPIILKVIIAYLCVLNVPVGAGILTTEVALSQALMEKGI